MKIKTLVMCLITALMLGGVTTDIFSMENETAEEKAAKQEGATAGAEEDAVNPSEEGLQSIRINLQGSGKSTDYIKTYIEVYKVAYEAANKEREKKAEAAEEALPGGAELKKQEDAAKGRKAGRAAANKDLKAGARNEPITTGNQDYDKAYNIAYNLIMQKTLPQGPKVAMAGKLQAQKNFAPGEAIKKPNSTGISDDVLDVFLEAYAAEAGRLQAKDHLKKDIAQPDPAGISEMYEGFFIEAYNETYEKEKKAPEEAPKTPEQKIAEEPGFQAEWFKPKKKVRFAEQQEEPDVKKLADSLGKLKKLLGNLKVTLKPAE